MRQTKYDSAFMFAYSQRDKTAAARHQEVLRYPCRLWLICVGCCLMRLSCSTVCRTSLDNILHICAVHLQICGCRPQQMSAVTSPNVQLNICRTMCRMQSRRCSCRRSSPPDKYMQNPISAEAPMFAAYSNVGRCAGRRQGGAAAGDHRHLPRGAGHQHGRRGRPHPPGAQFTLLGILSPPCDLESNLHPVLAPQLVRMIGTAAMTV